MRWFGGFGELGLVLAVSFISLALFRLRFRVSPHVTGERAADIVAFAELAFFVPTNESLVRARIDQFTRA